MTQRRFDLVEVKAEHLPDWVNDIIRLAKIKASKYWWSHSQPEILSSSRKMLERSRHSLAWSFDLDDMINEGCLAYLETLQKRPDLKNPHAYACKVAANAMGRLFLKEGQSHGFVRNRATGRLQVATGLHTKHLRFANGPHSSDRAGRVGQAAKNAAKTHCPQGHEYTPENTYLQKRKNGGHTSRHCRICIKAHGAARSHANRPRTDAERQKETLRVRKWRERKKQAKAVGGGPGFPVHSP